MVSTANKPANSMVDEAYRLMRSMILDNKWAPGHRALEQALAQELGMSRTPVREALIRLQKEGLVEVMPRHGMRVLPVSPDDMRDIYELLTAIEATAVAQGVKIVGADLVEVSPPFDPSGATAYLGVSVLFEILCVMAG